MTASTSRNSCAACRHRGPPEVAMKRYQQNTAQGGDALALLRSLSDSCTPLVFFDPQHRGVLYHLKFGNEGARQRGRAGLPAMGEDYIDEVCRESARVLRPGGYLLRWLDTYGVCEGHHLRVAEAVKAVDMLAWDSQQTTRRQRGPRLET